MACSSIIMPVMNECFEDSSYEVDNSSMLLTAVKAGDEKLVETLLKQGADPNVQGECILHHAIAVGNENVIELLIHYGADVNEKNPEGLNPMEQACLKGIPLKSIEALAKKSNELLHVSYLIHYMTNNLLSFNSDLLFHHVDIKSRDSRGYNALHLASRYNRLKAIEILVERGMNVEHRTDDAQSPLHLAVRHSSPSCIETLLKNGADSFGTDRRNGTPIVYLLKNKKGYSPEKFTLLLHYCEEFNPWFVKRYILGHEQQNFFIKHMAMLEAKDNELIDEEYKEMFLSDPRILSFYNDCLDEINKMKEHLIFQTISVYQFLVCPQKKLAQYTMSRIVRDFFRSPELVEQYPLFHYHLRINFKAASQESYVKKTAWDNLCHLMPIDGAADVASKILKYLSESDMKNLAKVQV